ncbi:MAG: hypothetical protein LBG60_02715 [Bifidobacteriaceae bacterium]|jgi:predicted transposase/invertase (TIGR01784 family)|nr:hypothetical protein [Bifidobacteriaceae bacterium]
MMEYVNLGREERDMVDLMEKAAATYEAEMAYATRRAAERAAQTAHAQGHAQGHARGLADGSERAARAVAARLLALGVDRAVVTEATGLADGELDSLP